MPYTLHKIPKASGGFRTIENPDPSLKQAQRDLLTKLSKFNFPEYVTCCKGRGLRYNVISHIGSYLTLTMDLKDFFGSVNKDMVVQGSPYMALNLAQGSPYMGAYSYIVSRSTFIENLCFRFNPKGGRTRSWLPQGAPTSPFLANVAALPMDRRILNGLPSRMNYTRYMDDISISTPDFEDMRPIISLVDKSARSINLQINEKKTKILYRDRGQIITGITMNSTTGSPTIKRAKKRILRAQLDRLAKEGKMSPEIQGYLAFVKGIDPTLHNKMIKYYKQRLVIHRK